MTSGDRPKPVLERILRYFYKLNHSRKHYNFHREFAFFLLKTHKNNHSSASELWRNTKSSFKENARTFSKNCAIQKNTSNQN